MLAERIKKAKEEDFINSRDLEETMPLNHVQEKRAYKLYSMCLEDDILLTSTNTCFHTYVIDYQTMSLLFSCEYQDVKTDWYYIHYQSSLARRKGEKMCVSLEQVKDGQGSDKKSMEALCLYNIDDRYPEKMGIIDRHRSVKYIRPED